MDTPAVMTRRLAWRDVVRCKFDLIRLIKAGQSGPMLAEFGVAIGRPPSSSTSGRDGVVVLHPARVGGVTLAIRHGK
jgi:hypothetical protein